MLQACFKVTWIVKLICEHYVDAVGSASMAVSTMREASMKSSLRVDHWSAVFSVQYALQDKANLKFKAILQSRSAERQGLPRRCARHGAASA